METASAEDGPVAWISAEDVDKMAGVVQQCRHGAVIVVEQHGQADLWIDRAPLASVEGEVGSRGRARAQT